MHRPNRHGPWTGRCCILWMGKLASAPRLELHVIVQQDADKTVITTGLELNMSCTSTDTLCGALHVFFGFEKCVMGEIC
jgi:hypothetical protein